ncbi:hypothetical protein HMPREF3173_16060 [Pseudomonas sp. HMSC08G10]|uniref:hypothetical protein n=1 Tax=Pseudomonas sp. HMSC08G10 TaxID=1581141 RepID=UPI0008A2C2E0|nr:hypothetical protein [Pseudomonas sp. HMSC08G10]OFS72050.1 hypothetical protein HMPREF3173_16060 [Pseudomonas sp. HMSC08G10]
MCVAAKVTEHDFWQNVDYLILCETQSPSWIAKIQELVYPRDKSAPLLFRFSEIRSIKDLSDELEDKKAEVFKPYFDARRSGKWPQVTEFEDDQFFTIGDHLPFILQSEMLGPLSMDKAVEKLAKTYGVDPSQVEIIIRSKPVASSRTKQM